MLKNKKPDTKRVLRNHQQHIPKVLVHKTPPLIEKPSKTSTDIEVEIPITKPPEQNIPDLSVPKLNSTLCVKKTIENVKQKKNKKIETVDDLSNDDKATYDEKITRQLNFPFDKKLYKKLISLRLTQTEKTPFQYTASQEQVYKDKVPRLEDFYEPPKGREYSIPVKNNLGPHTSSKQYDGLRLHKVMRTWKDNRPD